MMLEVTIKRHEVTLAKFKINLKMSEDIYYDRINIVISVSLGMDISGIDRSWKRALISCIM